MASDLFNQNPDRRLRQTGGWTTNSAGQAYIDDWVNIGLNGGIYQGTGTPASPTTGLKIYNSSGIGLIEMYKSGSKTFYVDTNGDVFLSGTITATAGSVTGGLTIGADGGFYQGSGTFASPTTGLKISASGGIGRLNLYLSGTLAASLSVGGTYYYYSQDADGKFGITADGDMAWWGTGVTADTFLYRSAAGVLTATDKLKAASFESTITDAGVAPFTVASAVKVTNLNADTLDGNEAAAFATSSHTHDYSATYAPIAKGVTNGDSHNHNGGDGAQIAFSDLSGQTDWTDWTPTVYQSTTSVNVTVTEAKYALVGKVCHIYAVLAITGDGVAANAIQVRGIPAAAACAEPAGMIVGTGWVYDSSATTIYIGAAQWNTATANHFRVIASGNSSAIGATPDIQLANGDTVRICATYRIS